ncbi:ring finger protein 14, variant [Capsaspora owczarzaki ATCC 30864]|nr:ring finger protein 14, variant [Capsaspora owczarzaki ATCC 30864]
MRFEFVLPAEYPSSAPPQFTLTCSWLTESLLGRLCRELDAKWNEQHGEVVLFSWLQWLQDSAFSWLGIPSKMPLRVSQNTRRRFARMMSTKEADTAAASSSSSIAASHPVQQTSIDESASANTSMPCTPADSHTGNEPPLPAVSGSQAHDAGKARRDPRGVQSANMVSILLRDLIDYDKLESTRIFDEAYQTCDVCFSDKQGVHVHKLHMCNHIFCNECLGGYFAVQIADGNVRALTCPNTSCKVVALPTEVRKLVSNDLYDRYERLVLQRTLQEMSDITTCPRQACSATLIVEPDTHLCMCTECRYAFCVYCRRAWHGISPCSILDLKELVAEYVAGTPEERRLLEVRYGAKNIMSAWEELRTNEWLREYTQQCPNPNCKAAIRKIEGCNKMACSCGAYFCWLCRKLLDKGDPYKHFREDLSECSGRLFSSTNDEAHTRTARLDDADRAFNQLGHHNVRAEVRVAQARAAENNGEEPAPPQPNHPNNAANVRPARPALQEESDDDYTDDDDEDPYDLFG